MGIRLVATVLVFIASDRVLGISGVIAVVINLTETHMAIHKSHHALGITVERHVVLAGLALVPRKRGVCRPFHYQQRLLRPIHRSKLPTRDVWEAVQGNAVERPPKHRGLEACFGESEMFG